MPYFKAPSDWFAPVNASVMGGAPHSHALLSLLASRIGCNRVQRASRTDKQGLVVTPAEGEAGGAFGGSQCAKVLAGVVVYIDVAARDVDVSLCVGDNGVAAAVGKDLRGQPVVFVNRHQPRAAIIF